MSERSVAGNSAAERPIPIRSRRSLAALRRRANYKDKIASGKIAIAVADTLPMQLDALKQGLATGNVGQRPFEMGYKVMYALKDMKEGKAAPSDPTYTGLDICTPDNVDHCVGGGS